MSKTRRALGLATTVMFFVTAGLDLALAIRRTVHEAHRDAARRQRAARRSATA